MTFLNLNAKFSKSTTFLQNGPEIFLEKTSGLNMSQQQVEWS